MANTNISMVVAKGNKVKVFYKSGLERTYAPEKAPKRVLEYLGIEDINDFLGFFGPSEPEDTEVESGLARDDEWYDPFFVSEDAKVIFYLVVADGEMRMDFLGVSRIYYADADKAKEWKAKYDRILEGSTHPLADKARAEVERIYKDMVPREREVVETTEDDVNNFNPVLQWIDLNKKNRGTANEQLMNILNKDFTVENLRKIARKYRMDTSNRTRNWNKERVIDLIVKMSESRATMGNVFFNYEG